MSYTAQRLAYHDAGSLNAATGSEVQARTIRRGITTNQGCSLRALGIITSLVLIYSLHLLFLLNGRTFCIGMQGRNPEESGGDVNVPRCRISAS